MMIAAMSLSVGTAYADPFVAPVGSVDAVVASESDAVPYEVKRSGDSVLISIAAGSLTTSDSQLAVRNAQGDVVAAVPLTYIADGTVFPIAAQVDGNTVTLTPSTDPAQGTPADTDALPLQSVDLEAAIAEVTPEMKFFTGVAGILGTITGAGLGCIAGAALGLAATAPVAFFLGAGPLAGCVAGALVGAPVGALGAGVIGGGATVVGLAPQFMEKLNQPPVTED